MGIDEILRRLDTCDFELAEAVRQKFNDDAKYIRELEMEVDAARTPSRGKRRRFDDED